jgi:hypothetical protein
MGNFALELWVGYDDETPVLEVFGGGGEAGGVENLFNHAGVEGLVSVVSAGITFADSFG